MTVEPKITINDVELSEADALEVRLAVIERGERITRMTGFETRDDTLDTYRLMKLRRIADIMEKSE